jgi:putative ABC transport system permease protein
MNHPPKWLQRLFHFCCPADRDDLLGDFLELYESDAETFKKGKLLRMWTLYSLSLLRLKVIHKSQTQNSKFTTVMFKTYFKIGMRQLVKHRLYTIINMTGLAVGLAAFTFISFFVNDELSYDRHFSEYDRIFRISGEYDQGGDARVHSAQTSYLILPHAREVAQDDAVFCRVDFLSGVVRQQERMFMENELAIVDSTFFDIFSMAWVSGNPTTALKAPNGLVIDQTTAQKYFGEKTAINQLLEIDDKSFVVTGVIEDVPNNTHFEVSVFIPMHGVMDWYPRWVTTNISGTSHYTYFKTSPHVNADALISQVGDKVAAVWRGDDKPTFHAQPIGEIHLRSELINEASVNGAMSTVIIFIVTALIILLLACINYVNLSVAGALSRGKEVGIKKVMGATNRSQTLQFQFESLILGLLSVLFSMVLVAAFRTFFNDITQKAFVFGWTSYGVMFLGLLLITVCLSIIIGSFPALFLLRESTTDNLSGNRLQKGRKGFALRNVMVMLQFFLAAILIASTMVITQQIRFMRNKDLGVDTEHVVMIPFGSTQNALAYETFRTELLALSQVKSVTASTVKPTNRVGGWRGYRTSEGAESVSCPTVIIAHDYFETMGVSTQKGRVFSREFPSDETEAYVLNEAAVKFFGLKEPIGSYLRGMAFTGAQWTPKDAQIIGVVDDFHFASLHDEIRPTVFSLSSEITMPLNWIVVKINGQQIPETLIALEQAWLKLVKDRPFYFEFMDDELDEHYQAEDRLLKVLSVFTLISILLGCLGLFGLTAFLMKRRTKEIGIRKILGATDSGLVSILSKDFLILVLVANIVGAPVAFWLMKNWLENFAYKMEISSLPFFLTALLGFVIAFLSIFHHTLKVTRANPVKSIRYE